MILINNPKITCAIQKAGLSKIGAWFLVDLQNNSNSFSKFIYQKYDFS